MSWVEKIEKLITGGTSIRHQRVIASERIKHIKLIKYEDKKTNYDCQQFYYHSYSTDIYCRQKNDFSGKGSAISKNGVKIVPVPGPFQKLCFSSV